MSALPQILERRALLLAEAEAQRRALSEGIAVCRNVLVVADRGIAWATWLRARPYLVVAAATAIAVLRPKFALAWSARVLTLWRVGRLLYDAVPSGLSGIGERRRIGPAERPSRAHRRDGLEMAAAFARVLARVDEVHRSLHQLEDGDVGRSADR